LVTKDPLFNEEKESVRRTARCHITLEKSSKTILLCFKKPSQAATHAKPPTSSQVATAEFYVVERNVPFAGAVFTHRIHSRDERGEGGVICETMPFVNGSSD
jgi:hypothetical protein